MLSRLGAPVYAEDWILRKPNIPVDWNVGITRSVRNKQKFFGAHRQKSPLCDTGFQELFLLSDDLRRGKCLTRWRLKHQGVSLKRSLLRLYLVLFQSDPAVEILIDQGCVVSYAQDRHKIGFFSNLVTVLCVSVQVGADTGPSRCQGNRVPTGHWP